MSRKPEPLPCPRCGAQNTVPIVYGYPAPATEEAARRGEIVLGGCIIGPEAPVWACPACGHEWGRLDEKYPSWFDQA